MQKTFIPDPARSKNEQNRREANRLLEKVIARLGYLFDRWQDEKDYEDFADYKGNIKRLLNDEGAKFIGLKQRPFELTYDCAHLDRKVVVRVTSKEFKVSQIDIAAQVSFS